MDQPPRDRRAQARRRRIARWTVFLGILAILAGTFHRFLFLNNFAVVEPGRVYRSAQPKQNLEEDLRARGIASVLNLRGGSADDWWYANEVATTARLGVDFYDLPLSADRRPTRRELLLLLEVLDRCRYPLWIHCKSGSDRTGLATALYELAVNGRPPEEARAAFSIWRGHIALFGPERLHEPIEEYARWLRQTGQPHTAARFRAWVEREYAPAGPPGPVTALRPGPRSAQPPVRR
jgi:protein tyrosine phosphatase (PTP) superfamily phosphohydrolase (DUF442 family)